METPGKLYGAADRSQSNQSNINNNNNHTDSKDEVDFVTVAKNHNNNNNNNNTNDKPPNEMSKTSSKSPKSVKIVATSATAKTVKSPTASEKTNGKERISIFSFGKKSGQKAAAVAATDKADAQDSSAKTEEKPSKPAGELPVAIGTPPRVPKFVKSSSISRLLGNTYNAKKFEKEEKKRLALHGKFNTYGGRRRANGPQLERFKRYSKEDGDEVVSHAGAITGSATLTTDARDSFGGSRVELVSVDRRLMTDRPDDLGAKAKRTISRGWGKLWWKRSHSVDISTPDPEFKVSYLGNVLTGWAKGEGCVEKQLNTLWRNYTQNNKPDVAMRIKVCASGLKATTRQHGLTEYWANRITHCCAPKNYPRVFCWIYRHEGRKLKHELRCHAVLCSKEKVVQDICNTLKENLESALREFKREKILRQNARLSLANAVYDNPSMPRRKILLSVGGNNYRPPLERSKSAPKLMAIEEAIGEEEGEEVEETNEPEMKPCCQKDSLYPAMTLGRRRCHRGHSIRRTGKTRPTFDCSPQLSGECCHKTKEEVAVVATAPQLHDDDETLQHSSDDSDDFEKVLKHNNYDSTASLANELMPYFDMSLHKNTSCSLGSLSDLKEPYEEEPLSLQHTISGDPNAHAEDTEDEEDELPGLRRNGICSDGEEDYLDGDEELYFQQASILNMLHRNSMRKMAQLSLSSDEGNSLDTNSSSSQHLGSAATDGSSAPMQYRHQMQSSISSNASSTVSAGAGPHHQHSPDSDEGSISSGCETASTVTANHDDLSSLSYRQSKQAQGMPSGTDLRELMLLNGQSVEDEAPVSAEEIYQRLESRLQNRHNSDATTFSSSSSITLKMNNSPSVVSVNGGLELDDSDLAADGRSNGDHSSQLEQRDLSDSECSDESGYVEFQEKDKRARESLGASGVDKEKKVSAMRIKPTPPPRPMPMPRRLLTVQANATTTV